MFCYKYSMKVCTNILYIIITLISFISCNKNENSQPVKIDIKGKWLIIDGKVYTEELETYKLKYYNHFSTSKTISSTDLDGANVPMEVLHRDITTWEFKDDSFLLNDSLKYFVKYERYSTRVYGLENGSAKILQLSKIYDNNNIEMTIDTKYERINGVDLKYYSVLSLKRIQ